MYFVINTPILLALFQAVLALPGAAAAEACNIKSASSGDTLKGSEGGSLEVRAGNGAYTCSLDETGSGTSWAKQLTTARINGSLTVSLPKGLNCNGKFKNSDDLCIIRCENSNDPTDTICSIFEQVDLDDQDDGADEAGKKIKKRGPEPEPKKKKKKGGRRNGNNRNNNEMNFSMDSLKVSEDKGNGASVPKGGRRNGNNRNNNGMNFAMDDAKIGEVDDDLKRLAKRGEEGVANITEDSPELEKRAAGNKKGRKPVTAKKAKKKAVKKASKKKKVKKVTKKVTKGRKNGNNRNNNGLNFAMDDLDVEEEGGDEEEEEEEPEEEEEEEGEDTELKRLAKRFPQYPQDPKDLSKRSMDLEPRDPKKKKSKKSGGRRPRVRKVVNKKKNTANGAKTGSQKISLSITPAETAPEEEAPIDEGEEVEEEEGEEDLKKRSLNLEPRDPKRKGRRVRKNKKVNTANGAKTGSQTISLNIGPASEEGTTADVEKRSIEPRDPKKKKAGARVRKNKKVNKVNAAKTGSQTIDIKVTSPAPAAKKASKSNTKTTAKKKSKTPKNPSKPGTPKPKGEEPEEEEPEEEGEEGEVEEEEEEEVVEPKTQPKPSKPTTPKASPPKEEPQPKEPEEGEPKEEEPKEEEPKEEDQPKVEEPKAEITKEEAPVAVYKLRFHRI
ncbi:hypothetical protein TWF506_000580 [Arthrobotrys conoides]|uniref:Uncharacterized protein n=1 Tax=Arthrobotrys conoides TaxID=74498 RepID=A0AAN8RX51_9PEZI